MSYYLNQTDYLYFLSCFRAILKVIVYYHFGTTHIVIRICNKTTPSIKSLLRILELSYR